MTEQKLKEFPANDIKIIKLEASNLNLAKTFDCGIKDLNDFLVDDTLTQQNEAINITYLWISNKTSELLGYITICTDSIHLWGEKKQEMKKIGIDYKALPALKICRMAVAHKFARQKIGKKMIAFAINKAIKINEICGCRFLTLEAKNDSSLEENIKPVHFYKKMEFSFIKERKDNSSYIPMYKDLKPNLSEIKR